MRETDSGASGKPRRRRGAAGAKRSPAFERLAAELRRVKQAAGLSYAELQSRTPYSRSSLERYINGKALPPKEAVRAIAEACGSDPRRLAELWDQADQARAAGTRRRRRWACWRMAAAVAAGAALTFALSVVPRLFGSDPAAPGTATPAPTGYPTTRLPESTWSRTAGAETSDTGPHRGVLSATIEWTGPSTGPYRGRITGSVRNQGAVGFCAIADAWYDGATSPIGQACGPGAVGAVASGFERTQRALVRVCLRHVSTNAVRRCSDWA
ncbi:helix-turn-helix domain-containing protein [Amycolatopsis sp. GA6-003]|uniref:helix-turn-helix domain-containing protein n=1 Tax=Amycolatopsis sp. GA6-003 TaxID=2652444 RepID=UPI0039174941